MKRSTDVNTIKNVGLPRAAKRGWQRNRAKALWNVQSERAGLFRVRVKT